MVETQWDHAFEREKCGEWVGKKEGNWYETRFYLFHLKAVKNSLSLRKEGNQGY